MIIIVCWLPWEPSCCLLWLLLLFVYHTSPVRLIAFLLLIVNGPPVVVVQKQEGWLQRSVVVYECNACYWRCYYFNKITTCWEFTLHNNTAACCCFIATTASLHEERPACILHICASSCLERCDCANTLTQKIQYLASLCLQSSSCLK